MVSQTPKRSPAGSPSFATQPSSYYARIKGDIGSEEDCKKVASAVQERFGPVVHVLVNNAAAFIFHSVETASAEDWDQSAAVNIKGHALLTKYLLPLMKVCLPTILCAHC